MIKKLKNMLIGTVAALSFAVPLAVPALAHAADVITPALQCGAAVDITATSSTAGQCEPEQDPVSTVNKNVQLALMIFSAIVGIIAVVMMIVGGVRYITSGGDSGNVTAAKNTILYAIIGLVVVALAQIIVQFVLKKFTGTS